MLLRTDQVIGTHRVNKGATVCEHTRCSGLASDMNTQSAQDWTSARTQQMLSTGQVQEDTEYSGLARSEKTHSAQKTGQVPEHTECTGLGRF